ncbi:MAG: hypothetical protein LBM71_05190 [Elusimicrobiota bacterium]|jgi:hypothetical protein|nr:hypothetical protein [Elusimicrobiota bacterium]
MFHFNFSKHINNKRAQIVLPALLLIPTIFLVIYLLFETTKLSREKIRHQFAVDTSAFVELTAFSHYLNATAYVNGAFPFRLFRETLQANVPQLAGDPKAQTSGEPTSLYEFFRRAGAFPAMQDYDSSPNHDDTEWDIKYFVDTEISDKEANRVDQGWNTADPTVDLDKHYPIGSKTIATSNLVNFDPAVIKNYFIIYYFLGTVYEDQKKVYDRISKDGEMFRKGYYLNTGDCKMSECGSEGASDLKGFKAETIPIYINKITTYFKDEGDNRVKEIPLDLEKENLMGGKVFQMAYLAKDTREKLKQLYRGVDITQHFKAPSNYFRVNVNKYNPHVHVRVALQCTREDNNCVWPSPTPKYQVRLYP